MSRLSDLQLRDESPWCGGLCADLFGMMADNKAWMLISILLGALGGYLVLGATAPPPFLCNLF